MCPDQRREEQPCSCPRTRFWWPQLGGRWARVGRRGSCDDPSDVGILALRSESNYSGRSGRTTRGDWSEPGLEPAHRASSWGKDAGASTATCPSAPTNTPPGPPSLPNFPSPHLPPPSAPAVPDGIHARLRSEAAACLILLAVFLSPAASAPTRAGFRRVLAGRRAPSASPTSRAPAEAAGEGGRGGGATRAGAVPAGRGPRKRSALCATRMRFP